MSICTVQILWEGHIFLKYLVMSKQSGIIFQICVAFSEYLNFIRGTIFTGSTNCKLQTLIFSRSIGLNNEKIVIRLKFSFSKKATNFELIFHLIWRLLSKCELKWKIVSNFCGLYRMSKLYQYVIAICNCPKAQNLLQVSFISPIFSPSIRRCDFGKKSSWINCNFP